MVEVLFVGALSTSRGNVYLADAIKAAVTKFTEDGGKVIKDISVSCETLDEQGYGRALVTILYDLPAVVPTPQETVGEVDK